MRGLIYKDFSIFYKGIDKRLIVIMSVFTAVALAKTGAYSGLLASIMLAMTIGMQNVMSLASDEKARWKQYQMAMPVSSFLVVASKYVSVICTLGISLLGSIVLNLLSSVIYHHFDFAVWGLAIYAAAFLPVIWTGVSLPLAYWFGVQPAQTMSLFVVIPMFYLIKFFEDGLGLSAMPDSLAPYLAVTGVAVIILWGISMVISVMGYRRKR